MPEEKNDGGPLPARDNGGVRRNRRRGDGESVEALFKPAFILTVGRGYTGKTTLSRWIWGRARRPLLVYDGDVARVGLRRYIPDAKVAASADDVDVRQGLIEVLNQHIEQRRDVLVDLGGGDQVFPNLAKDLELLDFLLEAGSRPVIFHLVGPDPDDLAFLTALEGGIFAPECTGVLFNEHLIPKHASDRIYKEAISKQEVLRKAIDRGALVARIPLLATADSIAEAGIRFEDAADGARMADGTPLGPVQRHMTSQWLKSMDRAMADMLAWLP